MDVIHNLPLHTSVVDAPSYIFAKQDYVEKRQKFKNVHHGILTVPFDYTSITEVEQMKASIVQHALTENRSMTALELKDASIYKLNEVCI